MISEIYNVDGKYQNFSLDTPKESHSTESRTHEVAAQSLHSESPSQAQMLFEKRYDPSTLGSKLSANHNVNFDCECLAHYLMTGEMGKFKKIAPDIYKLELKKKHESYTCYKIWQPNAPWIREEMGYWGSVHYFTHLENGQYISKNGCGPIRFFDSFEEMLKKDAFPFGFTTADYQAANGIEDAMIGESIVSTMS